MELCKESWGLFKSWEAIQAICYQVRTKPELKSKLRKGTLDALDLAEARSREAFEAVRLDLDGLK